MSSSEDNESKSYPKLDESALPGRPVPFAVTTVHLVREAEIQLRRPRLHLIPWVVWDLSLQGFSLKSFGGELLSNDKSRI